MHFLAAFSAPFRAALSWWPLLALVLTVPIIVVRALSQRRLTWSYLAICYLVVLYALGLGFFTLYPMPADPVAYCATHKAHMQLIPFHWVVDALGVWRMSAIVQVLANIVFFVPFGIFWWMLFHGRLRVVALAGFATSLLVETAQLTGIFGYYPCSFRLFDVDDLAVNTLGAVLGFVAARFVGADVGGSRFSAPEVPRTWPNRLLALALDLLLLAALSAATFLLLYEFLGFDHPYLFPTAVMVWSLALTVMQHWRGTPGELLVGIQRPADG